MEVGATYERRATVTDVDEMVGIDLGTESARRDVLGAGLGFGLPRGTRGWVGNDESRSCTGQKKKGAETRCTLKLVFLV